MSTVMTTPWTYDDDDAPEGIPGTCRMPTYAHPIEAVRAPDGQVWVHRWMIRPYWVPTHEQISVTFTPDSQQQGVLL